MPDLFGPLICKAVEADVALPGVGVLGHHQARADHRSAVALPGDMDRQLGEIELAALELTSLTGPSATITGLMQCPIRSATSGTKVFLGGAEGDGGVAHIRRRLAERAPAMRQLLEEQRLLARLIKERAHLGERVDRLVDADELAGGFQLVDPRSHGFRT